MKKDSKPCPFCSYDANNKVEKLIFKRRRMPYDGTSGRLFKTNDFKEFLGGKGLNQSVAVSRSGSNIYHAGCINKNDEKIKKQLNVKAR